MPEKKKITLTDIILFIAAGVIDLYQEIKDPFNLFLNYYKNFYGEVPIRWTKDHLRSLIAYSITRRYLKKDSSLTTGKLLLTKRGESHLKKNYPHIFYKPVNWDKKIRMAIFDIQELNRHKRNKLRRFLKQIGFIMLQKSVWVCPYDQFKLLKKWLIENNLEEKVLLVEASKINIKNKNELLSKFWSSNFSKA